MSKLDRARVHLWRLPRLALPMLAFVLLVVRPALPVETIPYGQGLLWRIEAPGGAVSHLFGTMHAADSRVATPPAAVASVLDAAESLTVEVVMTPAVRRSLAEAMVLREGRMLGETVGPALLRRVLDIGGRYGLQPWQTRALAPWALATLFAVPPAEVDQRETGAPILDDVLQDGAARGGLPLYGLESADEQTAIFTEMSEADQVALLRLAVDEHPRVGWWWEQLVEAYLARDVAGYIELMFEQTAPEDQDLAERFLERLIDARNAVMVERMEPRLSEGGALVAVGALHLPGERGILRLLEQRGHAIERVY
jgi:uncharacterized protein YbaP (TraB family)